ncbi:type VI secretion protein [Streptomyces albipurpureus]|uniref:Type VI secretion protein n=1 Tax=Streptomyces albipurpureus TaxID=2897419 RepID=A0ABT0V0J2_9ACTN|nr:type VI secretion protein [Streptomyces sp. CWNU-1]MCM2394309.1 type VI secretion protein [Streptomyces sp. CWNU-1]
MREHQQPRERTGGVPDGLLVGLIGLLFGSLVMAWTATGLAGLFAHGSWPTQVTFKNTPGALRSLISAPQDLSAAWPATPQGELSGYGMFWGILIGELMVLAVLAIFAVGTLARWKSVRAAARSGRPLAEQTADPTHQHPPVPGQGVERSPREAVTGPTHGVWDPYGPSTPTASAPPEPQHPQPGTPPGSAGQQVTPMASPATSPPPALSVSPSVSVPPLFVPPPSAASLPTSSLMAPIVVPAPRAQRLIYGDADTRRPTAVQSILDAAGPALVITSEPGVWAETKDARSKLGPVHVYDPGHLCDTPARLHWSPIARCEDAAVAADRATALLAPVRPRAIIDTAMADTAETLLRCWLHAAAVDNRPFKQVHRWAQGGGIQEAVRILRTHPKAAAGLAGLLESALTAHPERREIAQQLTARALSALSAVHIREACTPNRNDALALESFVNEGGTLYLVGEPIEDPRSQPGAMPLLTALASDVVEHGRRMAARSSAGRLDPPMTLVLDDVAAVAPLPRLPELLASGQDQGMPTLVLLRSAEQARARWSQPLPQ